MTSALPQTAESTLKCVGETVLLKVAPSSSEEIREDVRAYSDAKIAEIQGYFSGMELAKRGRYFIMQGPLQKICSRAVKTRIFFLLTDILIYGHQLTRTRYARQTVLSLTKLSVVSLPDEEGVVNAFQIFSDRKAFVVQARTPEEKTMWIENITLGVNQLLSQGATSPTVDWAVLVPPSGSVTACPLCQTPFTFTTRRKTCRKCGSHVCGACSQNTVVIPHLSVREPQRVCKLCYRDWALSPDL